VLQSNWTQSFPATVDGCHDITLQSGDEDTDNDFGNWTTATTDTDGDTLVDALDPDDDNDGLPDAADNCPLAASGGQANNDGDAQGDACDSDDDNDGFSDANEISAGSDPLNPASTPEVCDGIDNDLNAGVDEGYMDTDSDGQADCVDPDDDDDTAPDVSDNCPLVVNPDQIDTNGDGFGDACEPNTPVGAGVEVPVLGGLNTPGGLELTFETVAGAGATTAAKSRMGPPLPPDYRLVGDYYDITTTATFSGQAAVCVAYDEADVLGPESKLEFRHHSGVSWDNITTSLDAIGNVICGAATSFSLFAVLEPIDLSVGHISGPVVWNTSPVDPAWLYGGTVVLEPPRGTSPVAADGGYSIMNIEAPQTYTPLLMARGEELGRGSATPLARGETANAEIDATGTAGKVVAAAGDIKMGGEAVNGSLGSYGPITNGGFTFLLPPGTYSVPITTGRFTLGPLAFSVGVGEETIVPAHDFPIPGATVTAYITTNGTTPVNGTLGSLGPIVNGSFAELLPEGNYSAQQVHIGSSIAGTVDGFTVVAGQDMDLGTIDLSVGSIQGDVLWNRSPVDPNWLSGATVTLGPPNGSSSLSSGGAYSISNIAANITYTPSLSSGTGVTATGPATLVGRGEIKDAPINISNAGLVIGTIEVNDSPVSGSFGGYGSINGGSVELLLPVGDYPQVPVRIGSTIAGFVPPFTVSAGGTTYLGVVPLTAGGITGTVLWNTEAVDPAWLNGSTVNLDPPYGSASLQSDGTYSIANLAVGTYAPSLFARGETLGTGAPTPVIQNQNSTADIDITNAVGRFSAYITLNGAFFDGYLGSLAPIINGQVALLLQPGIYTEEVHVGSSIAGTVTFCVIAGEDTNKNTLDTDSDCNGFPDEGWTPVGDNITVPLIGWPGVGGLQVTFSTVASAGTTTVVESVAGRPPATGWRIIGLPGQPWYLDINTTADYAGDVEVCIKYDGTQVNGPEELLRLRHDDGSGWKDVSNPPPPPNPDVANDIICGKATTISPFAVMEPLDGDGDGVVIPEDNCPKAPNSDQINTDATLQVAGASVIGDASGDACDSDDDNDGSVDTYETYLSTAGLDNCPNSPPGPGGDAWPLDINMDMMVTVVGDILTYSGRIGATGGPPPSTNWRQRLDLNMDNILTVVGDVLKFSGKIGQTCS